MDKLKELWARAQAWLRQRLWVFAVAWLASILLVAVVARGCRKPAPLPPPIIDQQALVDEGRHQGAAEVLEQQAAEAGASADAIEARLRSDAGAPTIKRKPLETQDDEDLSRDLGDLVRRVRQ